MDKSKIIKNPQSPTEEQNSIINRFDTSQIEAAEQNNSIDERAQGADVEPSEFTHGTDYASDTPANQDSTVKLLKECESYCHEVSINEKSLRKEGRIDKP